MLKPNSNPNVNLNPNPTYPIVTLTDTVGLCGVLPCTDRHTRRYWLTATLVSIDS